MEVGLSKHSALETSTETIRPIRDGYKQWGGGVWRWG